MFFINLSDCDLLLAFTSIIDQSTINLIYFINGWLIIFSLLCGIFTGVTAAGAVGPKKPKDDNKEKIKPEQKKELSTTKKKITKKYPSNGFPLAFITGGWFDYIIYLFIFMLGLTFFLDEIIEKFNRAELTLAERRELVRKRLTQNLNSDKENLPIKHEKDNDVLLKNKKSSTDNQSDKKSDSVQSKNNKS